MAKHQVIIDIFLGNFVLICVEVNYVLMEAEHHAKLG